MKYERLTKYSEINEDYITPYCDTVLCNGVCRDCDYEQVIVNRLAEYEDKIGAGTLIELPCKVGDVVWYVISRGQYSTLCSTTVCRICIDSPNRMVIYLNATVRKIYIGYAEDDNAFLTKEEAEARLKELRGEV